jgi:hypothetical protein
MEDRTKVCWYCHKATMKPAPEFGARWYKCSECGATYDIPLEVGINPLQQETFPTNIDGERARLTGSRPSGRVAQAAAKARKLRLVT